MASRKKGGSSTSSKLSMKLLVNSRTQRVLYAEAGKDVVDFLFSLLTLPVSTIVKLLTSDFMVGCVGNLYRSVEKLDDTYILRSDAKDSLLTPAGGCESGKLLLTDASSSSTTTGSSGYYSGLGYATRDGFVQGIVTYTVMDDLTVAPMSTISGITMLNAFGIRDIGSLQEKTVQLGYAEGLQILKASLQSKTVLTDVFLGMSRRA
ncbi:hypothetical protein VPH35_109894 [Triticum aestivum]|uniref:uncharacterized protein n=1 Tax=Triticum aestivum TaxID=4565 RepID=UPI001D0106B1|nr:uncharacterized protein LOC123133831 [Triticum aestivum]